MIKYVGFWCETVVVTLTAGCVELQVLASSSRVRHNGNRVPAATFTPVSIWFTLITLEIAAQTTYMFMVIGDSMQMVLTATNHSSSINWPHRFTWMVTVPRALGPFTTGCEKLQIPSSTRDKWRHNGGTMEASENKSRGCCWRNFLPTVVIP